MIRACVLLSLMFTEPPKMERTIFADTTGKFWVEEKTAKRVVTRPLIDDEYLPGETIIEHRRRKPPVVDLARRR